MRVMHGLCAGIIELKVLIPWAPLEYTSLFNLFLMADGTFEHAPLGLVVCHIRDGGSLLGTSHSVSLGCQKGLNDKSLLFLFRWYITKRE